MAANIEQSAPTCSLPTESVPVRVVNAVVTIRCTTVWWIVQLRDEPIMFYLPADAEQRAWVAAQLVSAQLVNPAQACHSLEVTYAQMSTAMHAIDPGLRQAMLPVRPGPRGPWKLTAARQQPGAALLRADPQATLGEVTAAVNRAQSEPLSRRHMQRWRHAEQQRLPAPQPQRPNGDAAKVVPPLPSTPAAASVLPEAPRPSEVQPPETVPPLDTLTQVPLTRADQRYLEQLRQGIETPYGGGLLALPFLNALNLPRLVKTLRLPDLGYTAMQMVLTFFCLSWLGFPSLEATRWLDHLAFGVLLGRRRGPGLKTLRAFLQRVQTVHRAEAFTIGVARQLITLGVVDWHVLLIDGHFIPYFGRHAIRHGYFTVRRLAVKGQEAFYAHDVRGRPLLVTLRPGSAKLYAVIPEMIGLLKRIVGSQWGRWVLTIVFDRGGWCVAFLQKLDKAQVYWITWLKLTRAAHAWIDQLPTDMFAEYPIQLNTTTVKVWLAEAGVYIPEYGFCRVVIIDDRVHHRRISIGSNDHQRTLTELAQLILLRWGQENYFKRRKPQLDYTPGYTFETAPNDPLVANPQLEALRQEKNKLRTHLDRLQGQLGANLLERKRDTIDLAQYKTQHERRIQDIAHTQQQIDTLTAQLSALPKQVPISQVLHQPLEQVNTERKTFLDTIAILADQAEASLLDMLAKVDPGRDHRQVLQQIIHHSMVIQLSGSTLYVRFKPFDTPRLHRLATALCETLTAQQAHTLDKFGFLIVYEVMPGTL